MDTTNTKPEEPSVKSAETQPTATPPWNSYSVAAIANEIISISNETKGSLAVTNLRLQKLVYFAQGFALAMHGYPLFNEKIEAWTYGPVVPELYDEAKKFGKEPILSLSSKDRVCSSDATLISFLKIFINHFGSWPAGELVDSSHLPGSPWDVAFNKGKYSPIELWRMLTYFKQFVNNSTENSND